MPFVNVSYGRLLRAPRCGQSMEASSWRGRPKRRDIVAFVSSICLSLPTQSCAATFPEQANHTSRSLFSGQITEPEGAPTWIRTYVSPLSTKGGRRASRSVPQKDSLLAAASEDVLWLLAASRGSTVLGSILPDTSELGTVPAFLSQSPFCVMPSDTMTCLSVDFTKPTTLRNTMVGRYSCIEHVSPSEIVISSKDDDDWFPPVEADSAVLARMGYDVRRMVPVELQYKIAIAQPNKPLRSKEDGARLIRVILAALAPLEKQLRVVYGHVSPNGSISPEDPWRFADMVMNHRRSRR